MNSRTRTGARRMSAPKRSANKAIFEGLPCVGDVVAGKYAVEGVLGAGGMGVVLAARHVQIGARVAMKFLTREAARAPERVARLVREARAAGELCGEHVARVLDVAALDNGIPYIVMEHLSG